MPALNTTSLLHTPETSSNPALSGKQEKYALPVPYGAPVNWYKNHRKWRPRQWAWEFIRRNPDFINASDKVQAGTEQEKLAVARQFHLKQFKYYKEDYEGGSGKPKLATGEIRSWTYLTAESTENKLIPDFMAGQVLISFDLECALSDKRIIDEQLRLAEIKLRQDLDEYAVLSGKKQKEHKPKRRAFGLYICMLDHLACGIPATQSLRLIQPKETANLTPNQLSSRAKVVERRARQYAATGYQFLCLFKEKKKKKKQ